MTNHDMFDYRVTGPLNFRDARGELFDPPAYVSDGIDGKIVRLLSPVDDRGNVDVQLVDGDLSQYIAFSSLTPLTGDPAEPSLPVPDLTVGNLYRATDESNPYGDYVRTASGGWSAVPSGQVVRLIGLEDDYDDDAEVEVVGGSDDGMAQWIDPRSLTEYEDVAKPEADSGEPAIEVSVSQDDDLFSSKVKIVLTNIPLKEIDSTLINLATPKARIALGQEIMTHLDLTDQEGAA